MTKDWQLLKSLEYQGENACRYTCSQCKHFCKQGYSEDNYDICEMLAYDRIKVSGNNNICKDYEARIYNTSAPEFNFDAYLEYLMSDYFRPYTINKDEIRGSARLGEIVLDGGKLARMLPDTYSFFYEYYDYPFCRMVNPLTTVRVDNHNFQLDYRIYRKCEWFQDGMIKYIKHYWKDKPTQRKYNSELNGEFNLNGEMK